VVNLQRLGTLLPVSTSRAPFINNYEDIFALRIEESVGVLFQGGLDRFFLDRLMALQNHISSLYSAFVPLDAIVLGVLVGHALLFVGRANGKERLVARCRRALCSPWFVPVGFTVALIAFWAGIAPTISGGGGLAKCLATVLPVLVICALTQLDLMALPGRQKLIICLLLVAVPATDVASTTVSVIQGNNAIGANSVALKPMLRAEEVCLDHPVILMTRSPWEITQATGFPTVQIPNASLFEILQVAARYGVTDIELTPSRPAIADGTQLIKDKVFTRTNQFPGHPIFRITSAVGKPSC